MPEMNMGGRIWMKTSFETRDNVQVVLFAADLLICLDT